MYLEIVQRIVVTLSTHCPEWTRISESLPRP